MTAPNRQLLIGISLFFTNIVWGYFGYHWYGGWSPLDSIYMVIITIFGVGFGEVHPLTPHLQIFTSIFIVTGCTSLIYTLGAFINWLTEGQLQQLLGRHKMEKEINSMSDHIVICGYGRIGRILAAQLKGTGKDFVIIEKTGDQIPVLKESGHHFIEGDATEEFVLKKARIETAAIMATVIPNDAINVFIVLSCRALNPKVMIIARANQISSEAKLIQAGTDKVVSPAVIGADRIAHLILKPNARDVLEKDLHDNAFIEGLGEIGLELNEISVPSDSPLVGGTLESLETQGKSACMVIAVRKNRGESIVKPPMDLILEENDTLIVMSHQGFIPQFMRQKVRNHDRYRGGAR